MTRLDSVKNNLLCLALLLVTMSVTTGCANTSAKIQQSPNAALLRPHVDDSPKNILVFFDGSANDWTSRTNVRRLFELIAAQEDPKELTIYIEGVGSSSFRLTGGLIGAGMKGRVLTGYRFISQHYKTGDKIYIFGFSRGALQARTLAGLLAYNGIPSVDMGTNPTAKKAAIEQLEEQAKQIWKNTVLTHEDINKTQALWKSWQPNTPPPYTYAFETKPVNVQFLGIWDTVPGSSVKNYDAYHECDGGLKGTRYRVQPYPIIKEIAHAVALDEKRSKFRPLLVKTPYLPTQTKRHEVWFPGAHADVGGGYADSNDLAGISLNWMINLLKDHQLFSGGIPHVYEAHDGLAHWSMGDPPANAFSDFENRHVPTDAVMHNSVEQRKQLAAAPIRKTEKTLQPDELVLENREGISKGKVIVIEQYQGYNWHTPAPECESD